MTGRIRQRGTIHARLTSALTRLKEAHDTASRGFAGSESGFQRLEATLATQRDMSRELVRHSESLFGYVTGQADGEAGLKHAIDLVGQPLGFVIEGHGKTARLVERLRIHQRQMDNVRHHEAVLHQMVAPLKFIQTLFRVESATLPPEVQSVFTGLTKDIDNLQVKITEIFGEQFHSLSTARHTVLGLIEHLVQQTARQESISREKQRRIQSSLEDLGKDLDENQKRDVRLTKTSRAVAEALDHLVGGGESRNQAVRRTEDALMGVAEMLDPLHAGGSGDASRTTRQLDVIHSSAVRLLGQLQEAKRDLARTDIELRRSFESLARDTADIDKECMSLGSFKSLSAAEDGMVQSLLEIISELRDALSDTAVLQQGAYDTIRPLGGLASNLTGVMRQVSVNIKLIAINAQIQAAHVGQGTGLEVLSERTSRISDEIYQLNKEVGTDLDGMVGGLDEIVAEFRSLSETGQAQTRLLAVEGAQEELRLHAYRDATLQCFMAVGTTAADLEANLRSTAETLHFNSFVDTVIQPMIGALEALIEMTEGSGAFVAPGENRALASPRPIRPVKGSATFVLATGSRNGPVDRARPDEHPVRESDSAGSYPTTTTTLPITRRSRSA